jgi:HlyD family secretion protein
MSDSAAGELPIATPSRSTDRARKGSKPTSRRRAVLALAGLAVLLVLSLVGYERSRPAPSPFRTAPVVRVDITETVNATGTLQPVVVSPVGAQVSGIVWKLHADYNSSVSAGQVLVELDPSLFQNAVALATAQLAQADATLEGARAVADGARSAHARTVDLQRQALATQADVDAATALLGQVKGAARSAAAQVAQARAQLDRARLDLEHSVIRSPVNGTVISRSIDVGQAVASTLTAPTLFTIAQDLQRMQIHAAVDEADIGQVRAGQTATFTVDAFRAEVFPALVHEVRNAPQTLQNVVTYDVVLDVTNAEGRLRPGMTANVVITLQHKTQVAAVPNEALRFRPPVEFGTSASEADVAPMKAGQGVVYVPQGNDAVRTSIDVGLSDGNVTEVDGLAVGREVIIDLSEDARKDPAG